MQWISSAMKRVKITGLRDHLSEHLRAAECGTQLEVMDRYRPAEWNISSLDLLLEERRER
jgi:hypothetical protein